MPKRPPSYYQLQFVLPDRIDWSQCPEVESVPDRCSGAWVVKGTRCMVQGILDNAEYCSAEEIATEIFEGITVEQVRRILAFAGVTALDYSDIPELDDEFFTRARHPALKSPATSQNRRRRDYTAPPGKIWVCRYCGKRARDRRGTGVPFWDESCAANAVLCDEQEP